MLDLSVIILTYNEEIHIRRCLENVSDIAKDIFIIDSFSTDKTLEIAKSSTMSTFYKINGKITMQNSLTGD